VVVVSRRAPRSICYNEAKAASSAARRNFAALAATLRPVAQPL
jgi:hypothetical protein